MDEVRTTRSTRRALLAAAGGAAAALAVEAVARPLAAEAATGDKLVLGAYNKASDETVLEFQRTDGAHSSALSVTTRDTVSPAISAGSYGIAIGASSSAGPAIKAMVDGPGPEPGIQVESENGPGLYASTTNAPGVKATGRPGVLAISAGGVAVQAEATGGGAALVARGPVIFDTAGLGAVATGASTAEVHPGTPLGARSKILVTLMSDPGNATLLFVRTNIAAGSFTVVLAKVARAPIRFAYFVIS
jgi:hypothetical protein